MVIKDDSQMGQDEYIVEVNSKANDDIQRKRGEDVAVTEDGASWVIVKPNCYVQKDIVAQSDESIKTEKFSCSINYAKRHKFKLTFIVLVVIGAGMLLAAYLVGAFDAAIPLLCGKELSLIHI